MSNPPRLKKRRVRRPTGVTPERWVAWKTIARTFDDGAWTHSALPEEAEPFELDQRQRAQAQHLAYGTVRLARKLDYVIATAGKRPLSKLDAPVLHALRLGAFGLLESDGAADHAVVDQTVEIVRAAVGERAVSFANAVMRRIQTDGAGMLAALDPSQPDDRALLASVPEWMMLSALADHGEQGALALEALADAPGPDAWWRPDGKYADEARPSEPFATLLPQARVGVDDPSQLRRMAESGEVVVQSLASQLASALLPVEEADSVLDMCAAPGGKTLALAVRMKPDAHLVAVELHPHRARELEARIGMARSAGYVRCAVTVVAADATELSAQVLERLGAPTTFDRILLDAPCSGLGVIHRRPDSRWKRQEQDVAELAVLQERLLRSGAQLLAPGGELVYSVCTTTRAEAEDVVAAVVDGGELVAVEWPDRPSELAASGAGAIRTWPQVHETDGFFMVRLQHG